MTEQETKDKLALQYYNAVVAKLETYSHAELLELFNVHITMAVDMAVLKLDPDMPVELAAEEIIGYL